MFTKAIFELYNLRDRFKDDKETVESIDKIIHELTISMSAVLDMLSKKEYKAREYKN